MKDRTGNPNRNHENPNEARRTYPCSLCSRCRWLLERGRTRIFERLERYCFRRHRGRCRDELRPELGTGFHVWSEQRNLVGIERRRRERSEQRNVGRQRNIVRCERLGYGWPKRKRNIVRTLVRKLGHQREG